MTLQDKLVVAISSRALFDFEEENRLFEAGDDRAYMNLQLERLDVPAAGGVAMPLVKKLLTFNADMRHRVEVVILSRNDPTSGMRAFRSAKHHQLPIERGVFTRGPRALRLPAFARRPSVPVGQRRRRPGGADGRLPGGPGLSPVAAPGRIPSQRSADRLRRRRRAVFGRGRAGVRGAGAHGVPGLRDDAGPPSPCRRALQAAAARRCTSCARIPAT